MWIWILIFFCYMFPSILAVLYHTKGTNYLAIFFINIFFGWSGIAWYGCVWYAIGYNFFRPRKIAADVATEAQIKRIQNNLKCLSYNYGKLIE